MNLLDIIKNQSESIEKILKKGNTIIISKNKNGIVLYENSVKKIINKD